VSEGDAAPGGAALGRIGSVAARSAPAAATAGQQDERDDHDERDQAGRDPEAAAAVSGCRVLLHTRRYGQALRKDSRGVTAGTADV